MSRIRFDRLLSNRGYCSRRESQRLLKHAEVRHGTMRVTRADEKVDPDRITIDGKPLDPGTGMTILFNKPTGFVCSHRDTGRLIFELLPERWPRRSPPISSVGRLDKETSGLLILTDDGQLNHRLTAPRKRVPKVYLATVENPFTGSEAERFGSGTLMLEGESEPLLPAYFEPLSERTAYLTIYEGRYHQVRRMFAALGNTVIALHRSRIGALTLGDLPEGAWRFLDAGEIDLLFSEWME